MEDGDGIVSCTVHNAIYASARIMCMRECSSKRNLTISFRLWKRFSLNYLNATRKRFWFNRCARAHSAVRAI